MYTVMINGTLAEYDDAYEVAKVVLDEDSIDYEEFDQLLDESGPVEICGIKFDPSRILRELDPIAYNVYSSDWASEELPERRAQIEFELDRMYDGEEQDFNGYTVTYHEDEEEEPEDEEEWDDDDDSSE